MNPFLVVVLALVAVAAAAFGGWRKKR